MYIHTFLCILYKSETKRHTEHTISKQIIYKRQRLWMATCFPSIVFQYYYLFLVRRCNFFNKSKCIFIHMIETWKHAAQKFCLKNDKKRYTRSFSCVKWYIMLNEVKETYWLVLFFLLLILLYIFFTVGNKGICFSYNSSFDTA